MCLGYTASEGGGELQKYGSTEEQKGSKVKS